MTYYRSRLARIHAADYTAYAHAAASRLLVETGPGPGLVVDLGCGAGDLAGPVTGAGFDYLGIDLSPDMVALASSKHPGARFVQGSAFDLPAGRSARAIVAVGEVVNYAMDPRAGVAGLTDWLRACHASLAPGGLLLFDVAGPLRADPDPVVSTSSGRDYRIEVTVSTDPARRVLTRTIRISDSEGEDEEVHELHLIDPLEVMAALHHAGFRATAIPHYTPELPFPRGWSGFLARVIVDA